MQKLAAATAALVLTAIAAVAAPAAPAPCSGRLDPGVIPTWARGGFSAKEPRLPHTVGRKGEIAALVFGYPLTSPPAEHHINKILWVSRRSMVTSTALWIHAQRMQGSTAVGAPVTRIVRYAPGPSIIDLPAPGCWRLTLSWSGRRDTLDLRYAPRA